METFLFPSVCYVLLTSYQGALIPVGEDIDTFRVDDDVAWVLVVEKDVKCSHYLCRATTNRLPKGCFPNLM